MNSHSPTMFAVLAVAGISGCSTLPMHDPQPILPSYSAAYSALPIDPSICSDPGKASAGKSQFERFRIQLECAAANDSTDKAADRKAKLALVLQEGMALSDQICGEFFSALELRRREVDFGATSVTATATALTTVLAAAGTHARAVTNIAAALTGGTAILESYKVNFVLTPDLYKVHQHIKSMRAERLGLNKAALNEGAGLSEIKQLLLIYDDTCSVKAIQWVIREAVKAAQFGVKPPGDGTNAEVPVEEEGKPPATAALVEKKSTAISATVRALGAQPVLQGFGVASPQRR